MPGMYYVFCGHANCVIARQDTGAIYLVDQYWSFRLTSERGSFGISSRGGGVIDGMSFTSEGVFGMSSSFCGFCEKVDWANSQQKRVVEVVATTAPNQLCMMMNLLPFSRGGARKCDLCNKFRVFGFGQCHTHGFCPPAPSMFEEIFGDRTFELRNLRRWCLLKRVAPNLNIWDTNCPTTSFKWTMENIISQSGVNTVAWSRFTLFVGWFSTHDLRPVIN